MTQTTKMALAASLKKLMNKKTLDKITITDLTEDCEVNRQTFYYHFKDIYDLVEWIYLNEASKALGNERTYDTWQQGFFHLFEYALENKTFVINTYHSINRETLERFLYNEIYSLLRNVVEEKAVGVSIQEEDKDFIAHFYKYGFAGVVLDWIGKGMKANSEEIVQKLALLVQGNIPEAIERFSDIDSFYCVY